VTERAGPGWVLGVDSGGSGLRVALAPLRGDGGAPLPVGTVLSREPVRTGALGIDPAHLLDQVLPAARSLLHQAGTAGKEHGDRIAAVCVGAAGMATLGEGLRAELPHALAGALGVRRLALAADAVTAYAGALGERPGVVVAAGTGMIALGTDLRSWRRVDGWGHLLGDCGSGAWIGRAGLDAAMRAHDGRAEGSQALLARAEKTFGPMTALPEQLYPRSDRAAVLASFAPEVARCAEADPVAAGIVGEAARQIAISAVAACPTARGRVLALTGGLFRIGEPLLAPLRAELAERLPHATTVAATGDALSGALLIAARLAEGALRLPEDPVLLHVS
jgi:N-acetylglucosamine kinase-like BadF-type ATPase